MKKVLRTLVICLSLCLFLTISVKVYADDEIVTSDDGIIVSDENEPAVTSIEENNTTTLTDIKIIKSGKGWKKYSGKVGTVDGFDGLCDVYKVKVGKDFSLSIAE